MCNMKKKQEAYQDVDPDKYEMVPPEGGWGYIVCVGVSVIFIAGTAHQPIFGFIYNDFLEELNEGTSAVTLVFGVFSVMVAIGGFSANIALKKFSLRQVGVLGSMIYTSGSFTGIFVKSTAHLVFTNGFLQGFGMGIMIPIAYTSFNSYFTKKKVLYLSLCKASIGLCTMVYPIFIKYTMREYGFRGTLAILCAIGSNCIAGSMVMQPVEWHMVKKPRERNMTSMLGFSVIPPTPCTASENPFDFKQSNLNTMLQITTRSAENLQPLLEESKKDDLLFKKKTNLLAPSFLDTRRASTPVIVLEGNDKGRFDSTDNVYVENLYKAASISSLGNFGNMGLNPLPLIKNSDGKWQTVVDFLDLSLLKDPLYINIAFGLALVFFADLTFFALEPLLLAKYNFDKTEIANIIAVGGATDMCARLVLGVSGHFFRMRSRYMYFAGALCTAAARTVFLQFTTYLPILVLTGLLGSLRSLLHIAQPIVMADYASIERYPSAYGLYMLLTGVISLTVGPIIGFLRDYTGSYVLAFNMLTVCNLLCVVPWTVEALIRKAKRKTANKILPS